MIFPNLKTWLLILGLSLNVLGSVILAIPLFRSNEDIKKMSATYWDANPHLPGYLIKDRTTGILGMFFLILGFVLQLISLFV